MNDIIALAKEYKVNKEFATKFAVALEAEIRKEFEVEGERLRAYAAHERDLGAESFAIENNDLNQQITALTEQNTKLMEALGDIVNIVNQAGLLNLSRGVELGATSWYVKASDVFSYSRKLLSNTTDCAALIEPLSVTDKES